MTRVTPAVRSYRLLLERLDALVSQAPIGNVDPFVEALFDVRADLGRLARRWSGLPAPRNLRARHTDMRTAIALESHGFALWANALSTRDPEVIDAETEHLHGFLRSAAYLQKRWAAALRGALRRANLTVPRWLQGMATVRVR
jgi:hypothetical protein